MPLKCHNRICFHYLPRQQVPRTDHPLCKKNLPRTSPLNLAPRTLNLCPLVFNPLIPLTYTSFDTKGQFSMAKPPNLHIFETLRGNLAWPIHLTCTSLDTKGQFSMAHPPNPHIFEVWEETGASGGNPHRHGENLQTPHGQSLKASIKPWSLLLRQQC